MRHIPDLQHHASTPSDGLASRLMVGGMILAGLCVIGLLLVLSIVTLPSAMGFGNDVLI